MAHKRWAHGFFVLSYPRGDMDFWQVLPVALALVLIIEGILPFISPARWRVMIATVAQMEDRVIRNFGLGSMMLGLLLLYLVN